MERWSRNGLGSGTATGPRDKQKQQEYLQQKTEKFHLFSSPDAPTKLETEKRQTDGEKNHVKPEIFICSQADVKAAKFFLCGGIQIKMSYSMNVIIGEQMIIRNL